MKTALLSVLALAIPAAALEVHEWGTFTTFAGSDGQPLVWYQAQQDLARLPAFVGTNALAGKSAPALVRMETPVIYFYPEKEMSVSVEASLTQGEITETYPFALPRRDPGDSAARWSGTLHPPDDPSTLALVPPVTNDNPEEPYAAAREVPEAWIFRSEQSSHPADPGKPIAVQAEKFIFYRGSGQAAPGLHASADAANRITLRNHSPHSHPLNIALRVDGENAIWKPIPAVPAMDASHQVSERGIDLDGEPRPLEKVEAELVARFTEILGSQGLARDEAAAMVATWRATWFREEGLRVFTIIPPAWIEETLSLKIVPQPTKTVRVFVARLEILPPAKEKLLLSLLAPEREPRSDDLAAFQDLRLRRFSQGALRRVTLMETHRMQQRFHAFLTAPAISSAEH